MSTTCLDFDRLISEAQMRREVVPLDQAKRILGALLDECDLARETIVIRGGSDIALTPSAWIHVVRRAQELAKPREHRCGSGR